MINNATHNFIETKLEKIFRERFGIDIKSLDDEKRRKNLLGCEFCMVPRDLLYLFFDIEREFDIDLPEEEIAAGRFNSLENIASIIRVKQENNTNVMFERSGTI
jgi:peptide maturation system acyl carrier-related protein